MFCQFALIEYMSSDLMTYLQLWAVILVCVFIWKRHKRELQINKPVRLVDSCWYVQIQIRTTNKTLTGRCSFDEDIQSENEQAKRRRSLPPPCMAHYWRASQTICYQLLLLSLNIQLHGRDTTLRSSNTPLLWVSRWYYARQLDFCGRSFRAALRIPLQSRRWLNDVS